MSTYRTQFPLPSTPLEGLCINFTSVPGTFGTSVPETTLMRQAGFRWARQWVYRTDVQDGTGRYSWSALDRYVNDLTDAGFRIAFTLGDTISGGSHAAVTSASDINRFADFCVEMARRYSRLGPIFEIWNEPDNSDNWTGGDSAGPEYAAMARVVCGAIRDAVGEDAYLAGPAVDVNQTSFIQSCFDAGLGTFWDMCTVHTYTGAVPPETIRSGLRVVKGIVSGSMRNIRLGISEVGYASTSFAGSADMILPGTEYLATGAAFTGSVSGATNASPIVVSTPADHGLSSGAWITITGALGNTAANGTWVVDVTGARSFSLVGASGNGTWTSGGTWSAMIGKNLLQWSEDLTNGVWVGDSSAFVKTRCPGPSQLPSGTVAWNLSRGGGSGYYGIRQSTGGVSLKLGNTYSISAWMRSVSDTHLVFLNLTDLSGVDETAWNDRFVLTPEWRRYDHAFALKTVTTPQKFRITSKGDVGATSDIQVCNLQCELICTGTTIGDAGFRRAQLENQGDLLVRQFRAAAAEGVNFFSVYTIRDFNASAAVAGVAGLNHLGITDYFGVPKPAYWAIRGLSRGV